MKGDQENTVNKSMAVMQIWVTALSLDENF